MDKVIIGVDHPAIVFHDLEAACKWYCEVLDYEIMAESAGGAKLLKSADGVFLEAMPTDGSARPERGYFAEGVSHLALRVADLDKAIEVLQERGVVWTGEIASAVGGGKLRGFRDLEGNELQIVQR